MVIVGAVMVGVVLAKMVSAGAVMRGWSQLWQSWLGAWDGHNKSDLRGGLGLGGYSQIPQDPTVPPLLCLGSETLKVDN